MHTLWSLPSQLCSSHRNGNYSWVVYFIGLYQTHRPVPDPEPPRPVPRLGKWGWGGWVEIKLLGLASMINHPYRVDFVPELQQRKISLDSVPELVEVNHPYRMLCTAWLLSSIYCKNYIKLCVLSSSLNVKFSSTLILNCISTFFVWGNCILTNIQN